MFRVVLVVLVELRVVTRDLTTLDVKASDRPSVAATTIEFVEAKCLGVQSELGAGSCWPTATKGAPAASLQCRSGDLLDTLASNS